MKESSTAVEPAATVVKTQEVSLDAIEDPSQEDLCSVVQSGESEEEEEQDTLELELVLERKKVSFWVKVNFHSMVIFWVHLSVYRNFW